MTRTLVRMHAGPGSRVALVVLLGTACLDVSPVRGRRIDVDAGSWGGGGAGACESCIQPDNPASSVCAPELDACAADSGCAELLACVLGSGCFETHGEEEQNRCAVPCALSLGVTSPDETRVLRIVSILDCAQRECSNVCY